MNIKVKLVQRIRDKQIEIQNLEKALREAKIYLQATQDALRLLPEVSDNRKNSPHLTSAFRAGTALEQACKILRKAGKPLPVMDLLSAMGKERNAQNRQALIGSLGPYVRKKQILTRTAPNTFGLIEWNIKQKQRGDKKLPENFGR